MRPGFEVCTFLPHNQNPLLDCSGEHQQQHPREYGGAVGWWVVVGVMGRPWRRTSRRMRHPCVAVLVLSLVNANGFPEDEDANAH